MLIKHSSYRTRTMLTNGVYISTSTFALGTLAKAPFESGYGEDFQEIGRNLSIFLLGGIALKNRPIIS
jgi:hypothetical protein